MMCLILTKIFGLFYFLKRQAARLNFQSYNLARMLFGSEPLT